MSGSRDAGAVDPEALASSRSAEPDRGEGPPSPAASRGGALPGDGSRLARLDRSLQRLCAALVALVPSALAGSSLGLLVWLVLHFEQRAYWINNDLPEAERRIPAAYSAGGMVVCCIVYLLVARGARREAAAAWVRPLALVSVGGLFVAFHTLPGVEVKVPVFQPFAALMAGLLFAWATYLVGSLLAPRSWLEKVSRWAWPLWLAVAALVLGYTYRLSVASIAMHRNMRSHLDLAVYDNVLWNTSRGRLLGCTICEGGTHASNHFDPLLAVIAPVYRLHSEPETLLVVQSLWLASGAFVVFAIARARLGSPWAALGLAFCYLAYPPMQGVNLFAFHSLALCVPLVLAALHFLEQDRRRAYWAAIIALLLVREDMPLVVLGIASCAWLGGRRLLALASALVAVVYLGVVKLWLMTDAGLIMASTPESVSFAHYFKRLIPNREAGAAGLVVSLLSNPITVLRVALDDDKLRYLLLLLAPLCFLPIAGGRALLAAGWGFTFLALASRKPVFLPHFQYSSLIFPALFAALPAGIANLAQRFAAPERRAALSRALVVACVVSSLSMCVKHGAFVENRALRGGWKKPVWHMRLTSRSYRNVRELVAQVPDDARLATTRDLTAYASNRPGATRSFPGADYWLLNRKKVSRAVSSQLEEARESARYDVIARRGSFELHRRAGAGQ